ncbi:hypothetical protein GALL_03690 [mine drainage metagenome]|uniref:Uncharacterized protein n=1 Tax=mine drainage metagenome TaxID=410659 RepID=A0A1J5TT95_9ZZZZ
MLLDEQVVWRSPEGKVIACVEKNKVLQENLAEIRQVCQDALEDAVLMGCDERQFRKVLGELVAQLKNPYPPRE